MVENVKITQEEEVAVREVSKFVSSSAKGIRAYSTVPNVLGGTVVCVYFYDEGDNHVLVLVRGDTGQVFSQWENLIALIPGYKSPMLQAISAPQLVIAVLSIFVVIVACIMSFENWSQDNPVHEPFRSAFAAVIGYWLGQTTRLKA